VIVVYDIRSRYLADTVATAAPARLLTMLFDRLLLDLSRGEDCLREGRRPEATQQLAHAQEILAQLIGDLNVAIWDGGERLLSIYTYSLSQLISASLAGDADKVKACRELLAPLGEAWHEAAAELSRSAGPARPVAGALGVG
jgi:flagellar secretion chaperone FliS